MKRRQAIRSILSFPALTALPALAQQTATDKSKPAAQEKIPAELKPTAVEETPKLAMTAADAATSTAPRFFSAVQLNTLRRLSDLLVPALNSRPSATGASVPEFLDFLIGQSGHDRKALYVKGLDQLESEARRSHRKAFADLGEQEAAGLLAPLHERWTFEGPSDALSQFLHAAKADVLQATVASREWAATGSQRRGSGGLGTYWYSME